MREVTMMERRGHKPEKQCDPRIYTLKVTLMKSPLVNEFTQKKPGVSKTLRISGDHTLHDLHREILHAFNRQSEPPYEFHFDASFLSKGKEFDTLFYNLPTESRSVFGEHLAAGDVTITRIDSLPLAVGDRFHYWFDFDSEWLHRIEVLSIV